MIEHDDEIDGDGDLQAGWIAAARATTIVASGGPSRRIGSTARCSTSQSRNSGSNCFHEPITHATVAPGRSTRRTSASTPGPTPPAVNVPAETAAA